MSIIKGSGKSIKNSTYVKVCLRTKQGNRQLHINKTRSVSFNLIGDFKVHPYNITGCISTFHTADLQVY